MNCCIFWGLRNDWNSYDQRWIYLQRVDTQCEPVKKCISEIEVLWGHRADAHMRSLMELVFLQQATGDCWPLACRTGGCTGPSRHQTMSSVGSSGNSLDYLEHSGFWIIWFTELSTNLLWQALCVHPDKSPTNVRMFWRSWGCRRFTLKLSWPHSQFCYDD